MYTEIKKQAIDIENRAIKELHHLYKKEKDLFIKRELEVLIKNIKL